MCLLPTLQTTNYKLPKGSPQFRLRAACREADPGFAGVAPSLARREVSVLAGVGGVESEDDRTFWYPCVEEFVGDPHFSEIAVDPDFVVFDREISSAGKGAIAFSPTDLQDLVAIPISVVNGVSFDVPIF